MTNNESGNSHHDQGHDGHEHILSTKLILIIGIALLFLTVITVAVAQLNLGWMNFPVAMLIAIVKGSLVCLFFMGLLWDKKENAVILVGSFLFLAIFIVLTSSDLFFRPASDYVRPPFAVGAYVKSQFKKPWTPQPEILAHGKEVFMVQCVLCHGEKGEGNGVNAATMNPKPRNFTQATGWKNGRRLAVVFETVTKGLNQMPSFASLPSDDRWGAAQYVLSLGPTPEPSTPQDLASAGITDPSKDDGGMPGPAPSIPVDLAIELMTPDGNATAKN